MYPIYSMDIVLPVMKSRWEDASGKVPEYYYITIEIIAEYFELIKYIYDIV